MSSAFCHKASRSPLLPRGVYLGCDGAAAGSMHQFCQDVREIFPAEVENDIVEATTIVFYIGTAESLFGPRFAAKLRKTIGARLKYAMPTDMKILLRRIEERSEFQHRLKLQALQTRNPDELVCAHVTSVIESILTEAGLQPKKDDVVAAYTKVERLIREIKRHLEGIRDQNSFLMKKAG